jgi:hypothetical protein
MTHLGRTTLTRRLAAVATSVTVATGALLVVAPSASANPPTDDPRASQAAGWLARQLEANDYVMPNFSGEAGTKDFGLTIDALFVLAAAGVGGDVADQVVDKIQTDGWEYLQWDDVHDQVDIGGWAKVALALEVAGEDPTSFDISPMAVDNDWYNQWPDDTTTVDLIQLIRGSMLPDGHFGVMSNHFDQTLAVLALARTPEGVPAKAVDYLVSLQCTDPDSSNFGGLGFGTPGDTCGSVDGDATGFMLSGLLAAGMTAADEPVQRALGWMEAHQDADGGFPASWSGAGNTNSAGLVANAARQIGTPAALAIADKTRDYIAGLQVDCDSPFSSDDNPAAAGFARSWTGAIAYDQGGYDGAVSDGIAQFQSDQWRRASAQAALALGDLPGFSQLTTAGMADDAPAADPCTPVPAKTTTKVTALPTTSRYGAPKRATVTVASADETVPEGVVQARRGNTMIASASLSNGRTTVVLPASLAVGASQLKFVYVPWTDEYETSSVTKQVTVLKARTKVSLRWLAKPRPTRAGNLRIVIASQDGTIQPNRGTVQVSIGKRTFRAAVGGGRAVVRVPKLARGTYVLRASYLGSTTHAASPVLKSTVRSR